MKRIIRIALTLTALILCVSSATVFILGKYLDSESEDVKLSIDKGESVQAVYLSQTLGKEGIGKTEGIESIEGIKEVQESTNKIKISLAGDVLLDGHIRNYIQKDGYDYPWHYVREYFENDDVTIVNLETSITRGGEEWPDKQFNFRSDPKNVSYMKDAGVEVVSLANNHSLDYGYQGLKDTLRYLKEGDIKTVGAGVNKEEAMKAVIIDKEGIKIGILGFSRVVPDVGWWANSNRPGLVGAYDGQLPGALKMIEELKAKVDILIVSVHWGKELQEYPRIEETLAAKKMIDMGADVIAGHHAHVLQGIEIYKGRPIFYGLGNFVFGSKNALTANTMIGQIEFDGSEIETIKIIPFNIVNSRPQSVDEKTRQEKLQYLREISSAFNTIIDKDGNIIVKDINKR